MNAIRMMISLLLSSHFFANIWVLIGMQKYEKQEGWIYANEQDEIQNTDFNSMYIASFYWVITSFSSVGYGDIKGNTQLEYMYQMFVEMIGIGLFGYMVGTF